MAGDEKDKAEIAAEAILDRIIEITPTSNSGANIAALAEAYAWLIAPYQSHGGGIPQKA